jgi:hypothetical protein
MVSSLTMETWAKSSFCHQGGCVEVFRRPEGVVMLRESESPDYIIYTPAESWDGFIKGVKAGEFDEL